MDINPLFVVTTATTSENTQKLDASTEHVDVKVQLEKIASNSLNTNAQTILVTLAAVGVFLWFVGNKLIKFAKPAIEKYVNFQIKKFEDQANLITQLNEKLDLNTGLNTNIVNSLEDLIKNTDDHTKIIFVKLDELNSSIKEVKYIVSQHPKE